MVAGREGVVGPDEDALEAEQVVAVARASVDEVKAPAAELAPLGDHDPVGAAVRDGHLAVTAWDLFFRLSTEFSLSRPIPEKSSRVVPRTRTGRPASEL